MSAFLAHSPPQIFAGLIGKHRHATAHKPAADKVTQRRREIERRDYRMEVALVVYGHGFHHGVEL